MVRRSRCTECRRWFEPVRSAGGSQKVCGEACRARRKRKLARRRRHEDLEAARADERERKARSRAARREREAAHSRTLTDTSESASWTGFDGCHAPALAPISLDMQEEVARIVDEIWQVSRARLQREVARIVRKVAAQPLAPPSRAGP